MGKRKCYKQAYGKGSAEDAKRFKYSGQAIHSKDSTRGFLFSYRNVYIFSLAKRETAENKREKTWEVKTSNARGLQHNKVFYRADTSWIR